MGKFHQILEKLCCRNMSGRHKQMGKQTSPITLRQCLDLPMSIHHLRHYFEPVIKRV